MKYKVINQYKDVVLIYKGNARKPVCAILLPYLKKYKKELKWILLLNLLNVNTHTGWVYMFRNEMKKICK